MKAKITLLQGLSKSCRSPKVLIRKNKPLVTEDPKVIAYFKRESGVQVEILPEKGRPPKEVAEADAAANGQQVKKKRKKLVKKDD